MSSSATEHPQIASALAEQIAQCPAQPGVYHFLDEESRVLYVGKAMVLKNRVRSYFRAGGKGLSPRIKMMVSSIARLQWFITANEAEALILENSHIKNLSPKFNILFRDDKSYPFVRFSADEFARVSLYRGRSKKIDDCFGPYPNGGAVHETINLLQKVFQLRTCENPVFHHRTRPCLLHQIKRCSAPCVGKINAEDYRLAVTMAKRYITGHQPEVFAKLDQAMQSAALALDFERAAQIRDQLQALRVTANTQRIVGNEDDHCDLIALVVTEGWFALSFRALRAGTPSEEQTLVQTNPTNAGAEEIIGEFLRHRYAKHEVPRKCWVSHLPLDEEGFAHLPIAIPKRAREKGWLDRLIAQAKISLEVEQKSRAHAQSNLARLMAWLGLPHLPLRMECIDISHLAGEDTVGSWVVFVDAKPQPRDYRRYHLATRGGDDFSALQEMVSRRFAALLSTDEAGENGKSEVPIPDLLVIDGGVLQVRAVREIISRTHDARLAQLPIIGIAKGAKRIEGNETLILCDGRELQSDLSDSAFKLLLALRDEAHRFALTGQRAQRKKKNISSLESLEGIGPARRRQLLARFGSVLAIRQATCEQLTSVEGINQSLAKKIYDQFHLDSP